MEKAFLLLADGTRFEGEFCGARDIAYGEIVFYTGMTGYQEVLTDPAYSGQIVCMTYPLIGNYGISTDDFESDRPWLNGFIVQSLSDTPSNWRSSETVRGYLVRNGVTAISGVDTRALTRHIRDRGAQNCAICPRGADEAEIRENIRNYRVKNTLKTAPVGGIQVMPAQNAVFRIGLWDFGVKKSLTDVLLRRGCEVSVLPEDVSEGDILRQEFDGLLLTNGPGDPRGYVKAVKILKNMLTSGMPIFGVGLGHQLLALAAGGSVERLPHGHHGANYPVFDAALGRTVITRQNHNFAVTRDSASAAGAEISHFNLNDNTVEGLIYKDRPVFSVQFNPEGYPGPRNTELLFDRFLNFVLNGEVG